VADSLLEKKWDMFPRLVRQSEWKEEIGRRSKLNASYAQLLDIVLAIVLSLVLPSLLAVTAGKFAVHASRDKLVTLANWIFRGADHKAADCPEPRSNSNVECRRCHEGRSLPKLKLSTIQRKADMS
jgi:hypothetical protein